MRIKNQVTIERRTPVRGRGTLSRDCVIEPGVADDWRCLAQYHYRSHMFPPGCRAIYRARYVPDGRTVGVVVYAAPALESSARHAILNDLYRPGSHELKRLMGERVNREIDLMMRLVVHPTFRGCGIAVRLAAETMPLRGKRFIEANAAMAAVNPCLEKAGMESYELPPTEGTLRVLAALRSGGIGRELLGDRRRLLAAVRALGPARALVEREMLRYERHWIQGRCGRHPEITLESAADRIAGNATLSPRYLLWRNPNWQDSPSRSAEPAQAGP